MSTPWLSVYWMDSIAAQVVEGGDVAVYRRRADTKKIQ